MIGAILASGFAFAIAATVGAGDTAAAIVSSVVMALGIVGFGLMLRSGLPAHERRLMMQMRCSWPKSLGIALLVALAARIGVGIVTALGEQLDTGLCKRINELDLEPTPQMWQKIAIALSLVVLAPLGEELVFRTILLRGFVRLMPFMPSAVVSGLLFGAAHIQYYATWPVLVGVGGFGIANAYVYRRFGYRTAVLTHAIFNLVAAIFLFVDMPANDQQCPT